MAIAEGSIVPLGTGFTSISDYVSACLDPLEDLGLALELHGMGTIIEGDLKDLLAVITKMHEVPFSKGALRVVTSNDTDTILL